MKVVVVGAGVGGLTTAAILARAGLSVTVLEAHIYPGGCAGTFYHQGYHFEAGATLAGGFYPGGPMDLVAQATGIDQWPTRPSNPAMVVHLPDGTRVTRWTDETRWAEREAAFGARAEAFWQWQERTADALWNLALRSPAWPPQNFSDAANLTRQGLAWLSDFPNYGNMLGLPSLALDAMRPVAVHLRNAPERLRLFVDAQLLIAAQTTSRYANALYGASALDLPRRGVVHLKGGIGAIARSLASAVGQHGGHVLYRQPVSKIILEKGQPVAVETERRKRKRTFSADMVVFNLPPWNIAQLLGSQVPRRLRNLPPYPHDGWGAFLVYLGLDQAAVQSDLALHHQIIVGEPLAEGNSVFLSLSPAWDDSRAPQGQRALTLSTHTKLADWWRCFEQDRNTYETRKQIYTERMLKAAATVLPGLRDATQLILPGTPITFQRFTQRKWGWVGGFPQTNLFRAWGPRLASNLWLVGDSIFPGQSTAAVALGGMRVAHTILAELGVNTVHPVPAVRARTEMPAY